MLDCMAVEVFERREEHKKAVEEHEAAVAKYEEEYAAWEEAREAAAGVEAGQEVVNLIAPQEEPANPPAGPPPYEPIDPLVWWRTKKLTFPHLAWVARWLFAINASAAEVERVFSRGGLVIRPHRNRLGAEKEELFLITAYNLTLDWKVAKALGGSEEAVVAKRLLGKDCDCDDDIPDADAEPAAAGAGAGRQVGAGAGAMP
jgi:hypothetical protein